MTAPQTELDVLNAGLECRPAGSRDGRTAVHRAIAWSKDDPIGAEFARVRLLADRMCAAGVAIGSDPEPYRLDYELTTATGFLTTQLAVKAVGERWERRIELARLDSGWKAEVSQRGRVDLPDPGGNVDGFETALDPDLGLSPLFNTMPVLRSRVHEGGATEDLLMLWISVPDLSFHPSPQRYTHRLTRPDGTRVIRFEAVGDGEPFMADIAFDVEGLVVDYPGIARRVRRSPRG